METIEVLKQLYDEEMDKVFQYSGNYLLTIPRKGYDKEFEKHKNRADVLNTLIHDLEPAPME